MSVSGRVLKSFVLPAAAMAAAAAVSLPAQAQQGVQAGTLSCSVAPGVGLVVASQKALNCVFRSRNGRRSHYTGTVTRVGLDVGVTGGGTLLWAVYAPTSRLPGRALAGEYVGGSAEATAGAGLGANVLVGGNNRTISLQPLSVQGQTGISLAAGVGAINLAAAR